LKTAFTTIPNDPPPSADAFASVIVNWSQVSDGNEPDKPDKPDEPDEPDAAAAATTDAPQEDPSQPVPTAPVIETAVAQEAKGFF